MPRSPLTLSRRILQSTAANLVSRRTMSSFPVTAKIQQKLTDSFQPTHLDVINESHMHNVPKNSETHFKVVIVSSQFETVKAPIQRHRLVNTSLAEELEGSVHALSIVAKSPTQWAKLGSASIPSSPSCRGGDGSLPPRK